MPHAIFSFPQIGSVGFTEEEIKEKNIPYVRFFFNIKILKKKKKSGITNYQDTVMGKALKANYGFVKVLIHKETREILGCHIIGEYASILIHEV